MLHPKRIGIPLRNGEPITDMGGPCRNVGSRDGGPIDEKAAAKSLALYCKPVELYNIIRSRFSQRPVFLQRCLNYKICALRQRRNHRGNVEFHYLYYSNRCEKTEVTEEFSCPFCLVRCFSFKGLRCHLNCTHDLFNFEYLVCRTCSNVMIRGEKTKERDGFVALTETEKIVLSVKRQRLESRSSDARRGLAREDESPPIDAHGQVATAGAPFDELGLPSAPAVRIRAEKTRQATPEAAEARNRLQLLKRPFYHSHTGQPMAPEAVLSDRDSEDDVDEELAVLEDRRMLDDFVDVSNDEKDVMHLWNSFVRKQRVVADGHCQWACEAFTTLHSQYFASKPSLRRCLMLLLVKLWNHHLVDGSTLDKCLTIVDSCSAVTELPPT
ncbi:unnamed protein product [Sphagnum balticum]